MNEDFHDLLAALIAADARFPITFDEAWEERIIVTVDDLEVPCLGRSALIRNKIATGRLKDLADLESLGEIPE